VYSIGTAGFPILFFFLLCVIVAGVFGAFTAKRSILYIQALPGLVALLLVWLSQGR
jgi:putative membrane protein